MPPPRTRRRIANASSARASSKVTVGGDLSITLPIMQAARMVRHDAPSRVAHFDSHSDAFPPAFGTIHHAGGFRMAAEQSVIDPAHIVQIGLLGPFAMMVARVNPPGASAPASSRKVSCTCASPSGVAASPRRRVAIDYEHGARRHARGT